MNSEERIFSFKEYYQMNQDGELFNEIILSESKLEDKHIKLYCGQLIKLFQDSPIKSQEMFKQFLKENQ